MDDTHNLQRFVDAQDPVYDQVCAELRAGDKTSHWMWFIFPQLQGLGRSTLARHFAVQSITQAQAYWQHPVLGSRLKQCVELLLAVNAKSAREILGTPDDLKLCSSLTLFAQAAPHEPLFERALGKYFEAEHDHKTLALLGSMDPGTPNLL